ncbi:unnamed protein product [Symbiodinium natans]|uniref:Uncharacterized protein n=1 Tax=Symbiodinium natans TaxID=878477 RepID=A0A812UQE9_9DINO|nr:unnamed protein product [Symbiodinium natans]
MLMAGGMGAAFMGMAPFASPNFFMIGLLAAMVQCHMGYAYMQRIYWTQRRRYVLEITREEDSNGKVSVVVTCDAGVERRFALTDEAASPSLADIITKGGTFMFIDKQAGSILQQEMLDELLQSDRGIQDEKVTAKPVMEETAEQSLRIVQKFKELTLEHLDKIPEKDNTSSPQEGLRQLERAAQIAGAGCMVGGLFLWVLGDWSAQAAIRAAAENYKPQATLMPEGANAPPMRSPHSRAAQ